MNDKRAVEFSEKENLRHSYKELDFQNSDTSVNYSLNDFKVLKFVGKGSYCRVYLVQNRKTLDYFAMKVVKAHSLDG